MRCRFFDSFFFLTEVGRLRLELEDAKVARKMLAEHESRMASMSAVMHEEAGTR